MDPGDKALKGEGSSSLELFEGGSGEAEACDGKQADGTVDALAGAEAAGAEQAEDSLGLGPDLETLPSTFPSSGLKATVRLRVEYMSNKEAHVLSWMVFGVTLILLGGVVAATVIKFVNKFDSKHYLFETGDWYVVHLVVAVVVEAVLVFLACKFCYNMWRGRRKGRAWKQRRWTLTRDAGVMLGMQMGSVACWLGPYALVVGRRCYWFENMVAVFGLLRWTFMNNQFLWMLIMAHGSCRYRGKLQQRDPNLQLVMDAPYREQVRLHLPKVLLWAATQAIIIFKTIEWLSNPNDKDSDAPGCEMVDYECSVTGSQMAAIVLMFVAVAAYGLSYQRLLRRAFADHAELAYAHYRLSNMYIRIMSRQGSLAFCTVLVSTLLLQVIQMGNCWSYIDISLGALPIQTAMSLLVAVQAALLMPKAPRKSDVLMAWLQMVAWTEADLPAALQRRDYRLRRAHFALRPKPFNAFRISLTSALGGDGSGHAGGILAWLGLEGGGASTGSLSPTERSGRSAHRSEHARQAVEQAEQQAAAAEEGSGAVAPAQQQRVDQGPPQQQQQHDHHSQSLYRRRQRRQQQDPMFCMERAVRLCAWSQYAYRHWWADGGGMSHDWLMGLFGLSGFEAFRDPQTDTRALLGWREGCMVLAFRGTASKTNAVTDVKAWKVTVSPARHHLGRRVKVHAGFLQAYTATDDRHGMMARIEEIVAGFTEGAAGLKIFLTGHSLGGALAVLAASDLARVHPDADLTIYTFGAPKVGNSAFADEYRELVADSWAVVNDQDPVPRVPAGTGFRRCGLPVLINGRGDIVVRPTFFERQVAKRSGGNPSHHRLPRYALSLASIIKAQFSSAKVVEGGLTGARQLASTLDLGRTLLLRHADLASLANPALLPVSIGASTPSRGGSQTRGGAPLIAWCADLRLCSSSLCDDGATSGAAQSLMEDAEEGQGRPVSAQQQAGGSGDAEGVQSSAAGGGVAAAAVAAAAVPPAQQAMVLPPSPFS